MKKSKNMKQKIELIQFCEKYNITMTSIYVAMSKGRIPKHIVQTNYGQESSWIDESYFKRRFEFKRKVYDWCHSAYYFLNRYFTDSQIAYIMHTIDEKQQSEGSWYSFVNESLFFLYENNSLKYKVSKLVYKFYRYTRWLLSRLFKIVGLRVWDCDLDTIHDLDDKVKI